MDLTGLNITLSRIGQIENKINFIDEKFNQLLGDQTSGPNSFDNVLNKKINEIQYLEPPPESKHNENLSLSDKSNINRLIEKYANKNGLDKQLVNAVVKAESNYDNKAISSVGAQGLMQLMPSTARGLGVSDPFDPEQNIAGGTKYLKSMIDKYNSIELGLAAYNAGPTNVNKYGGVPPFNETQNYVRKVMELQKTELRTG